MERPPPQSPHPPRPWGTVFTTIAATFPFALLGLIAWTGCTVTEANYHTLSFFFDGVPDPTLARDLDGRPFTPGDPRRSPSFSIHKPYEEDNCDACHQGRMKMSRRDSDVCLKCHEQVRSAHEYMHGPVAAGECLWCHSPHESAHAALLRDVDRNVCTTCHTAGLLTGQWVPAHTDPSRACLECHFGHGGTAPSMLREGVSVQRIRESSDSDAPVAKDGGER
jgi:predicted CXXCH cytochrome family protein